MTMNQDLPTFVNVVEVGARDGLQNEATALTVRDKVTLVDGLSKTGLKHIEVGSFVSPHWVPQMANSDRVLKQIERKKGIIYSALTPNMRGFNDAVAANADMVAVFASASESFSHKNINCDIATSIERFTPIIEQAKQQNIPVRGYVSCVLGCPYEGEVSKDAVLSLTKTLLELGCYEVSLGDTIGVGSAGTTNALLNHLLSQLPAEKLALHCHDTYGQALTNIFVGLQHGIDTFDSSVAGLGGCPYAKGASGNVASEDLVYMLNRLNIESGIDFTTLSEVGEKICQKLQRRNQAKSALAFLASRGK